VSPPSQDWTQPLVWLVAGIFVAGIAVGIFVADARAPSYALGSELVYRIQIGAVLVGALLFVVATFRLASYGRTFTASGVSSVKTEADDPASAMDAAVQDVARLGDDIAATAAELEALVNRVGSLEDRLAG
jgi:cell shape-determining protein MreC